MNSKLDLKYRIASLLMIEIELLADDIIGDGVADDALATIPKFKKKAYAVCGEVIYGL